MGPSANSYAAIERFTVISFNYYSTYSSLIRPPIILPLFRNFTVEQRRIGLCFMPKKELTSYFYIALSLIYYIERNMYASEIEQEALTLVFGRLDEATQNMLAKKHLISDKFGLGDTRLSIDFKSKTLIWGFNLGFFTTIPTAFAFKRDIEGSTFDKMAWPPQLDILNFYAKQLRVAEKRKRPLWLNLGFGIKALDNLSANS